MARRRRARRYYPRARRVYSSARGGGGRNKQMIDGLMAGAIGGLANKYLPIRGLGQPIAALGVGMFRNNSVLKTEGSRELGAALVSMFIGNGSSGGNGGAY